MNNRTIRRRSLPDIFRFETGLKFRENRVRYDKCEINIDLATSPQSIEQIAENFRQIAEESDVLRFDGSDTYPMLVVRKKSNALFSGTIKVVNNSDRDYRNIRAFLNINPTRYFAHNPANRRIADRWERLFIYHPHQTQSLLRCYDGNDNYITDSRNNEANQTNWNDLTREFINSIRFYIQTEFEDILQNECGYNFHERITNWTINHLEYYWEFSTAEGQAKNIAQEFCDHLKERFARVRETYHLDTVDRNYTSVSYIFDTGKENQTIAIYAKTSNRIRVECRFSDNVRTMFSGEIDSEEFNREYESNLFSFITYVRKKAIKVLNPLKKHHETLEINNKNAIRLMADAFSAIAHEAGKEKNIYFRRMINSYMDSGKIAEIEGKAAYNAFLRRLKDRGTLEPLRKKRGKPRLYRINAPVSLLTQKDEI